MENNIYKEEKERFADVSAKVVRGPNNIQIKPTLSYLFEREFILRLITGGVFMFFAVSEDSLSILLVLYALIAMYAMVYPLALLWMYFHNFLEIREDGFSFQHALKKTIFVSFESDFEFEIKQDTSITRTKFGFERMRHCVLYLKKNQKTKSIFSANIDQTEYRKVHDCVNAVHDRLEGLRNAKGVYNLQQPLID